MICSPLRPIAGQGLVGPVVVVVMDGIGLGRGDAGDAVAAAKTPYLDRYRQHSLAMQLTAHGRAVGMPNDADMGNSEVGHNTLGGGRIFDQGAKLVAHAIRSGDAFRSSVWAEMTGRCVHHNAAFHFVGLLSDGNVHSHIDHLLAMVQRAHADGVKKLFVHALLDGRDVAKTSALQYIDQLEAVLEPIDRLPDHTYKIASGGGRMQITMDRYEADWAMVARGWDLHVRGQGRGFASARQAVETFRQENPGINDQELPGFVIHQDGHAVGPTVDGDAMIAFNFRGDRMIEWVRAWEDEKFVQFHREPRPKILFAGMTLYDGDTQRPRRYIVEPPQIQCTLGELLCQSGIRQLACAETQKFGHVTYFWNGNRSGAFSERLERYIEIPSLPAPFDAAPQMRAAEIAATTVKELATGHFKFARINFANGDMVGHTGNFNATKRAVEVVDECLGILEQAIVGADGAMLVTADHGNADDMAERDAHTGQPRLDGQGRIIAKTSHSCNPVPFYAVMSAAQQALWKLAPVPTAGLGNVAATAAALLGFATPEGYLPPLLIRA